MEAFAERIRGDVDVTLLGLRVWGLAPGDGYDMGVEVAWDPAEAKWRSAIGSLRAAAGPEQAETFREMLMAPGEPAPPSRRPVAWDFRDDVLGTMLSGHTGFESSHLARIGVPVLLVRGGRSAVRFGLAGRRLGEVCPDFRESVFPALHHFAPPFREDPEGLADVLRSFWLAA